jgi:hypothetical protein
MMSIVWARFVLALVGILVWAYGYRVDDSTVRWVGIGCLAVAVLLRFVRRQRPPPA